MKKDHRVKYIEEFHKQWLDKEQEPVSHMDEKWKKPSEIHHSKMDTQGMSGPADPNYKGLNYTKQIKLGYLNPK